VQLLHPALEGAPGHAHWRAVCARQGGAGLAAGLFSVVLDGHYSQAQVDAFCDALQLFRIGYSWGGPVSLVVPYDLPSMRSLASVHLEPGHLVRFSMGMESAQALIGDLHSALQHLPL
jgi:cystathionine beta-lyase